MSANSGIVWLASYPKSGNTWTRHFIHSLVKVLHAEAGKQSINEMDRFSTGEAGKVRFEQRIGRPLGVNDEGLVPALRPQIQLEIANALEGAIFLKTHNALLMDVGYPLINPAATAGAVYIVRNPLDVAISLAHHRGKSINNTIAFMGIENNRTAIGDRQVYEIWGSWSQHVYSWTRTPHPAIYVMRYEDMLANPVEIFGRLARHLRMNPTPEELELALDMSSFENLKAEEEVTGFRERPEKATASFFREGRAAQWKEQLSRQQIEAVVTRHREQMERFGYWPLA